MYWVAMITLTRIWLFMEGLTTEDPKDMPKCSEKEEDASSSNYRKPERA